MDGIAKLVDANVVGVQEGQVEVGGGVAAFEISPNVQVIVADYARYEVRGADPRCPSRGNKLSRSFQVSVDVGWGSRGG